jgi:DHA1 family multidrug resistance protein-like MFS transporter
VEATLKPPKWVATLLYSCVFLHLFSEVLLSPFYPLFFEGVFGLHGAIYTGLYIFACRLTVVALSPVWGSLSRRISVSRLLAIGQWGSGIATVMLANSQSYTAFLLLSVVLLVFKSSYFLLYPTLVQVSGRERTAASTGGYHAVVHLAIILSSVAGVWLIGFEAPLTLFYGLAVLDVVQWVFCRFIFRRIAGTAKDDTSKGGMSQTVTIPSEAMSITDSGAGEHVSPRQRRVLYMMLLVYGLMVLFFHLSQQLIRPFFTEYVVLTRELPLLHSSVLFLLPSVMFLFAWPVVRRIISARSIPIWLGLGLIGTGVGLWWQGSTYTLAGLILARLLFGFCASIAQSAMEVALFTSSQANELIPRYGTSLSFQNLGLLAAPLIAAVIIERNGIASPFYLAAGCILIAIFLAMLFIMIRIRSEYRENHPYIREFPSA